MQRSKNLGTKQAWQLRKGLKAVFQDVEKSLSRFLGSVPVQAKKEI